LSERRVAVIDLGSNSFRLVVFTWQPERWWKRTDEIYESVRIGEGLDATGDLQPEPMERALETLELFAHFCRHTEIDDIRPVATSAIREAANQKQFLKAARKRSGLDVRVLAKEEEAHFGYLAAVNTTRLVDGVALDIGGGSMQLTRVNDRLALDARSWALGAVRMTERFMDGGKLKNKRAKALREHVREQIGEARWLGELGRECRLAGIGGTVRNLGAAAMADQGLPAPNIQGFELERKELSDLIERFGEMTPAERGKVPGIKPERGDIILAGAIVIETVMEGGGFDFLEVSQAGLREGVFFAALLEERDPPLFEDVRQAGVLNLAAQYGTDFAHAEHVAALALGMWDALAEQGVHRGDAEERELLWAAAMLHDIGTAVDYDDHHKHSRYLILNAGLPGHSPRETALIAQIARYHRKGSPSLGDLEPLARKGDDARLRRCAALLRLAEQLERSRDQLVRGTHVEVEDGTVRLELEADEDVTLARWSAERHVDVFERAFGKKIEIA
jgi:exopolyphosphatase/guanosine-5'-triphosphate,3'-diphosphate pyrophosphatase